LAGIPAINPALLLFFDGIPKHIELLSFERTGLHQPVKLDGAELQQSLFPFILCSGNLVHQDILSSLC
jgi:hypothetical protein